MYEEKHYCRLCAGYGEIDSLIDLSVDKETYKQVNFFFTSLQTKIILTPESGLPTAICFVCFNFLNLIQQFVNRAKESQVFLTSKLKIAENEHKYTNTTSLETSHDDDDKSNSSSDSSVFTATQEHEEIAETFEPLLFEPEILPIKLELKDGPGIEDTLENLLASNAEAESESLLGTNDNSIKVYHQELKPSPKSFIKINKSDVPTSVKETVAKVEQIRLKNLEKFKMLTGTDTKESNIINNQLQSTEITQYTKKPVNISKSKNVSVYKHANHGLFLDASSIVNLNFTAENQSVLPTKHKQFKPRSKKPVLKSVKNTRKLKKYTKQRSKSLHGYMVIDSEDTNAGEEEIELTNILKASTADAAPIDHKPKWRSEIESPKPFVWTCMETGCSKTFETMELLAAHHTRDHGIRIKKWKNGPVKDVDVTCKECNIVFTSYKQFWSHNYRLHKPEKHKICEKCGKLFTTQQAFIYHNTAYHDTKKSHVCLICNKSFKRIEGLRNHVKFHMKIKVFQCNECGKELRSKSSLICHMMTHTGLKPYSCKICKKSFRTKTNMKTHVRTHTGDSRFECKPCGRIFSCWSNCNKHMKRIHNTTIKKTMEQTDEPDDKNPKVDLEEWKKSVLPKRKRSKGKMGCQKS